MTIYIIFEILKTLSWSVIFGVTITKRKIMPANILWLTLTSAALMITAGVQDIINYPHLQDKSVLWFFASIIIIANYFVVIRNCCRINSSTHKDINDFIERIEEDKKRLL